MALNITPAPTGESVDSFAYQQWMLTLGQLLGGTDFDEATQDAVGGILVDSSVIDFTYDDTVPSITATVKTDSINDTHIDWGTGANQVSTTDMPEGTNLYYTDERAQDATGGMVDTSLVYVDATPLLTRAALTGDISAPQGSNTTTLATVNANVGTFGSSSQVAQVTVNAKGLTTAAANVAIDHGSISGLGDDDHALYLLASDATNRTTFAANWLDLTDGGTTTLHTHTSGTASAITVANEATDTSCYLLFATAATGDLGPKSNANLTFNSSTGVLTSASLVATTADINGGTIDGATIGGATPAASAFTTVSASGQITSTVTTGTAPLVIASTTKVANLNADILDDQSGAYYLDSANFTGANWTDLTDSGATTLHKHDHGGMDGLADNDHPQYLLVVDIDDIAVNGEVAQPISSNWAFDHVAAADPHTGYRLESADHNHQSTGAQAGQLDHGLALTGLTDDDHGHYWNYARGAARMALRI